MKTLQRGVEVEKRVQAAFFELTLLKKPHQHCFAFHHRLSKVGVRLSSYFVVFPVLICSTRALLAHVALNQLYMSDSQTTSVSM